MDDTLDEAAVRHVAHLARLELADDEVARFADQLSSILRYMDQLNELDTTCNPSAGLSSLRSKAVPVTVIDCGVLMGAGIL